MDLIDHMLHKYPDLGVCVDDLRAAIDLLAAAYRQGGKLLVCGNGGSAADSEHIVGELMKGYRLPRALPEELQARLKQVSADTGAYIAAHLQGALPAISLVSQVSLTTAYANDVAPDLVFAQQAYGYGRPGDVLIGISTSGASANVLYALTVAQAVGMRTIGLTGLRTERILPLCDVTIAVPREATDDIQEGHQALYHCLCGMLEELFFAA